MNGLIFSLAPLGGLATALPAMSAAATRSFETAGAHGPLAKSGPNLIAPHERRLDGAPSREREDGYLFF